MPAPTALLKQQVMDDAPPADLPLPDSDHEEDLLEGMNELPQDASAIQPTPSHAGGEEMEIDEESKPKFAPIRDVDPNTHVQSRKVPIPPHRMKPLRQSWSKLYPPLVESLKIQVRMNTRTRCVELRTSEATTDDGALQKGEDFVRAFSLGFSPEDAIALLRLDDLFIETFEIKDVRNLSGDHLSRAIGRLAGSGGKMKFAIENASRTRVVLADSKIHILGAVKNIQLARHAISSLILGKPNSKVFNNLRTVSTRMKERF